MALRQSLFSYLWQITTLSFLLCEELCSQESDFCSRKPSRCFISFALHTRKGRNRIMTLSSFKKIPYWYSSESITSKEAKAVYLRKWELRLAGTLRKIRFHLCFFLWLTAKLGAQPPSSVTGFLTLQSTCNPVILTNGTLRYLQEKHKANLTVF